MTHLFVIFGEVQAQRFYYIINLIDIIMYTGLSVIVGRRLASSPEYVFPLILFAGFSTFALVALCFSLKDSAPKYKVSIYYAFMRSFMNYILFLGSIAVMGLHLWTNAKQGFIFYLAIVMTLFEFLLDFYWTVQLREVVELLNHNHMLRFFPDEIRRSSHAYFTDLLPN